MPTNLFRAALVAAALVAPLAVSAAALAQTRTPSVDPARSELSGTMPAANDNGYSFTTEGYAASRTQGPFEDNTGVVHYGSHSPTLARDSLY